MTPSPKTQFDFLNAALDSRITFTRALDTATRVNAIGNIELVNADAPRFNYDPITRACVGLLVEESRVNVLRYSQDITGTFWVLTDASVGTSITSPDGTANMQKIVEEPTNG